MKINFKKVKTTNRKLSGKTKSMFYNRNKLLMLWILFAIQSQKYPLNKALKPSAVSFIHAYVVYLYNFAYKKNLDLFTVISLPHPYLHFLQTKGNINYIFSGIECQVQLTMAMLRARPKIAPATERDTKPTASVAMHSSHDRY